MRHIFKKQVANSNLGIFRSIEVTKYRESEDADYWINVDEQYTEESENDQREKTFSVIHLTKDEMIELYEKLKNELFPEEGYRHMSKEEWERYLEGDGIALDRSVDEYPKPHE